MRKIKALIVTVIAYLCCIAASAHDFVVDGIYYNITSSGDLTVSVTYQGNSYYEYSDEYSGFVVIPEKVTYDSKEYSVTSIGSTAFYGCSGLTSVTIPNSVTSIEDAAFYNCSGLTSVTIPNSVTSIGIGTFSGCSSLATIEVESGNTKYDSRDNCNAIIETKTNTLISGCMNTVIPNSVTSIGERAFGSCSGLKSVSIPNSVTSIGLYAFNGCSGLTSVTIPNSVTSIGSYAFNVCSSLTSVTIGNSVTSIGNYAFRGCSGLTSVTIPNSVTSIGSSAFSGCSGLTSVTIGNSVTSIGDDAFEGTGWYNNLPDGVVYIGKCLYKYKGGMPANTSITIKNGTTSIGPYAFYYCSGLTSVTIPNSVTSIGNSAFSSCSGLTAVHITDLSAWCKIIYDGNNAFNTKHALYLNGEKIINLKIPEDIEKINDCSFADCSSLKSLTIPNTVKCIGDLAFYNCSDLTSMSIGNSIISIGNAAFSGCSGLTSVTIPNSVTSIGVHAFEDCSRLTSVTIGNSVTSIEKNVFSRCYSLKSFDIPNSVTSIEYEAFKLCTSLTSITIPNSVTNIEYRAFYDCSGLTSVTIGNSVTSIGQDAFRDCKSLYYVYNSSKLDITKGATSHGYVAYYAKKVYNYEEIIDDYLFTTDEETGVHYLCGYAGNATELNLPKNYKGNNYCIADGVFRDCINITSVTIPNSVTSIGFDAFWNCSGLTAVHITDLSAWCKIDFAYTSSNPTYYAHHLYLNGEEIINLVIPDDVTSIGDYAFSGFSGMTRLTIPNSVTSIGNWAFYGCFGLTAIKVDSENTKYDSRDNCNAIIETETNTLIKGCKNTVIPNSVTIIGEYAFYDLTGMPTITIPKSVEKICYGALAYWNNSPRDSLGIKNINIEELSQAFKIKEQNGAEINYFLSYRKLLLNGKEISELVIPEGIDTVSGILSGASQFKSLVIPKTVKEISFSIFENCKDLMYVYSNSTTPPVMQTGWVSNGFSSKFAASKKKDKIFFA